MLSHDLDATEAAQFFDVSTRTISRARREGAAPLLAVRYPHDTHRERISDADRGLLAAIIDELLPVRSGRRWRIQ
jgi:hypothetical protein